MPNILHAIFTFPFIYDKGDLIDSVPKVLNMHTLIVTAKIILSNYEYLFIFSNKTNGMKIEIILLVVILKITMNSDC